MAFIQIPVTPVIQQRTATKEQSLTRDTMIIKNQGGLLLKQLASYAQDTLQKVWQNKDYTAQEWFDKQNKQAAEAMQQHGQLIMFLASQGIIIDTSCVKAYTINQDGTVTVTGV